MHHFGPKMAHLPQSKKILEKIFNIIFIYLLVPFIVQNFWKILTADPDLWGAPFWVQNGPFAQMRIFSENLLISLVPFIHAYLHAKN